MNQYNSETCPECGSSETICLESFASFPYKWQCNSCHKIFIKHYGQQTSNASEKKDSSLKEGWISLKEGWVCPRCGKVNAPWVLQCTCTSKEPIVPTWNPPISPSVAKPGVWYSSPACEECPNNPKNGGSGHCNCILGNWGQVTCDTR